MSDPVDIAGQLYIPRDRRYQLAVDLLDFMNRPASYYSEDEPDRLLEILIDLGFGNEIDYSPDAPDELLIGCNIKLWQQEDALPVIARHACGWVEFTDMNHERTRTFLTEGRTVTVEAQYMYPGIEDIKLNRLPALPTGGR